MFKYWILNYKNLSFEERTIFHARFSILFNFILASIKIVLGIAIYTVFLVTAVLNIFMMLSRWECLQGVTKPHKKSFLYRNTWIGVFLILAGVQYTIYMLFLLFKHFDTNPYSPVVGISIAFVSFIELGVAIKGVINAYGKGHYYRNIKIINLCSAFTAMALTAIAITSFASSDSIDNMDCWVGLTVGIVIILNGIYVFIAPKISIVDREHNVYQVLNNSDLILEKEIHIQLTNSKFYGNYTYEANHMDDRMDGNIVKEKSPLFKMHWFWKIFCIILSEILIFPYALGAFLFHLKSARIVSKLDSIMASYHCIKIQQEEEEL